MRQRLGLWLRPQGGEAPRREGWAAAPEIPPRLARLTQTCSPLASGACHVGWADAYKGAALGSPQCPWVHARREPSPVISHGVRGCVAGPGPPPRAPPVFWRPAGAAWLGLKPRVGLRMLSCSPRGSGHRACRQGRAVAGLRDVPCWEPLLPGDLWPHGLGRTTSLWGWCHGMVAFPGGGWQSQPPGLLPPSGWPGPQHSLSWIVGGWALPGAKSVSPGASGSSGRHEWHGLRL